RALDGGEGRLDREIGGGAVVVGEHFAHLRRREDVAEDQRVEGCGRHRTLRKSQTVLLRRPSEARPSKDERPRSASGSGPSPFEARHSASKTRVTALKART